MKIAKRWMPFVLVFFLAGCLYPEDRKNENRIPYKDQIQSVQTAVEDYQKDTMVLPIKNRDAGTDLFQKYPIDFNKLVPKYLQDVPGNSFEKGGTYQYVLIRAEDQPTVKLVDLVVTDNVQDVQMALDSYIREHRYPPFTKVLAEGRYAFDHKKLGLKKKPTVTSPFTGRELPLILDNNAKVMVDYKKDLADAIRSNPKDAAAGEDIRYLLADHSFFSPAHSVPYTAEDGKPVFLIKQ
ncbi:hypothetical protein ACFFJY_09545 [Fictibacillus aquaticus]|uniref:ABC transporter periplasmic binding protein yphF n=1 Tax=Fictibacillus aquaticus TaxID=2021314 RepID=A0A235FCJ3_9BACL|nr:hypothetical protein [Fictibacillus aquaticus]OYD58515.1 hypothetical protein CGZ90_01030 [Fictibacillus aquaticus]